MLKGNKTVVVSFIWKNGHLEIWVNYTCIFSFERESFVLLVKVVLRAILIAYFHIAIEVEKTIKDLTFKR